jgi:YidC/Oxa1 family membrane protein insertase
MRSQGYKPDVFGNITSGFKRKPAEEKAPEAKPGKPPAKK